MKRDFDPSFVVYTDTPAGRDPDSHSPTLRRYHQLLWSKPLPDGRKLAFSTNKRGAYLYHASELGEIVLSSDAICHSYRSVKATAPIIAQVPAQEMRVFYDLARTVAGYLVFPARQIDRKLTINMARGLNSRIRDRFDRTLECIRLHYLGQANPLSETLTRYGEFFDLFGDFDGYVSFFLLQDLVEPNGKTIKFFSPFHGFDSSALFEDVDAYRQYKANVESFIFARRERIVQYVQGLPDQRD